jgi:FKBP-type peptidyl-prolyl cis-trans isomerase
MIMTKRVSLVLASTVAICLAGCNKPADSSAEKPSTPSTPTAETKPTEVKKEPQTAPAGDWKTTASGLKYQVLKQGTGTTSPKATDTV